MKLAISLLSCLVVASPAWAQSDKSANTETQNTRPEPPMMGKHLAKGQSQPHGNAGSSPQLVYHGGDVMAVPTVVHPIFWGTGWKNYSGDKISGMTNFYQSVGGTTYLQTNTEYTEGVAPNLMNVVNSSSLDAVSIDTSSAPKTAPRTSAILAEVCKVITNPQADWYYPVYVDTKRGHTGYCAWHSWSTCKGIPITFAFFFNLDGDPGCDPADPNTVHSQGLEALANVSGHELSEMLTDPRGEGWWDASGAENSDKCAWTFGGPVTFGGQSWKIQGNWSNAAYLSHSGYDGAGCIQTKAIQ